MRSDVAELAVGRITDRTRLGLLVGAALILIAIYMLTGAHGNWEYVLPRRSTRIFALLLSGTTIAASTVLFQTITNNRILTPSIMGLDSLYLLIQTAILFLFGTTHIAVRNTNLNFMISIALMLVFSLFMYRMFFAKERANIYFLLLIGIVFGTFFQSISSFMQVLIDPNEFLIVQDRMFASFNNVKSQLLGIATAMIAITALFCRPLLKYVDVLALGKEHAINLGVDYPIVVRRLLMAVFSLIAISTALVGPITFLGLIVANVAYEFMQTYQRKTMIVASSLIAAIALIGGQLVVERLLTFSTTLSVIINLIGGIYFLHLILKERATW